MLTVMPPGVSICSFSTTQPTPGGSTRVFGATLSPSELPLTVTLARLEPSALLPLPELLAIATTPSAAINPLRIITLSSVALLPASAGSDPSPVAIANTSCALTNVPTETLADYARGSEQPAAKGGDG